MRSIPPVVSFLAAVVICGCQSAPKPSPPTTEPSSQIVRLRHVDAADLATTLQTFLEGSANEPESPACEVKAHAATNSLLIRGDDERVAQVLTIVRRLDVPPGS